MGPVVPVLITVAKVAGTALALKSVVEGLKEGNLLKAALGGVGAYFGLSGLGAFGTGTQAASLGTGVGDVSGLSGLAGDAARAAITPEFASQVGSSLGTTASQAANQGILTNAGNTLGYAGGGLSSAGANLVEATTPTFTSQATNAGILSGQAATNVATPALASTAPAVAPPAAAAGAGGTALDFLNRNPTAAIVGGQALSGYAQGAQAQETAEQEAERREKEEAERRARIGAGVPGIDEEKAGFVRQQALNLFNVPYAQPILRRA